MLHIVDFTWSAPARRSHPPSTELNKDGASGQETTVQHLQVHQNQFCRWGKRWKTGSSEHRNSQTMWPTLVTSLWYNHKCHQLWRIATKFEHTNSYMITHDNTKSHVRHTVLSWFLFAATSRRWCSKGLNIPFSDNHPTQKMVRHPLNVGGISCHFHCISMYIHGHMHWILSYCLMILNQWWIPSRHHG